MSYLSIIPWIFLIILKYIKFYYVREHISIFSYDHSMFIVMRFLCIWKKFMPISSSVTLRTYGWDIKGEKNLYFSISSHILTYTYKMMWKEIKFAFFSFLFLPSSQLYTHSLKLYSFNSKKVLHFHINKKSKFIATEERWNFSYRINTAIGKNAQQ